MKKLNVFATLTLAVLTAPAVPVGAMAAMEMESNAAFADASAAVDSDYQAGQVALDAGRWEDAAARFAAAAAKKGPEADAATYWQAYAEKRQGHKSEALAILATMQERYPKSAWLDDARALEVELRGGAGQDELSGDDELKVYALNSLMANDSPRAVELLRQFLAGNHPRKLQEQALFVLSQSEDPAARQLLVEIAQGQKQPELREKAIEMLGIAGGPEDVELLNKLYASLEDRRLKEKVLDSFLVAGETGPVLAVAKGDKDPQMRVKALQILGAMGASDELRQLYRTETDREVKRRILEGLFVAGDVETLATVAKTETDRELRRKAIESLGVSGSGRAGEVLKEIYKRETDVDMKEAVLNAFFVQDNAKALIEVAKEEKDPQLRRAALQKLSIMSSPEALDFLLKQLQ